MPESEDAVEKSRHQVEEVEPIPEAVRPVPEHSALPAIQDGYLSYLTRAPGVNGAVASILIFLVIIMPVMISPTAAVNAWPASAWLYQTLGLSVDLPGDDLALERVRATYTPGQTGEQGELNIDGRIINLSRHAEDFHRLRGTLMRKGDQTATIQTFTIDSGTLDGESQQTFSHKRNIELDRDTILRVAIMPPWVR
jgi:hypothetical protein